MKYHKFDSRSVDIDGLVVSEVITKLMNTAEGLVEPRLNQDGYDNYTTIEGWIPMTPEEIEKAKAKEKKKAAARKRIAAKHKEHAVVRLKKEAESMGFILIEKEPV